MMNPKYIVLGFVALGVAVLIYEKVLKSGGDDEVELAGDPIVEVVVPELSARGERGETLFKANCASCHGLNAAGQEGVAPPLVHKIYEPSHHGDASFILAAQNGVRAHHWPFGNMPPIENVSRAEVEHITAYVRELQRANGIF